jgi:hypothetical protein
LVAPFEVGQCKEVMKMATEDDNGLEQVIGSEVLEEIKNLHLALLRKAKKVIEDCDDDGNGDGPVDANITAEQLMAMLVAVLSGQTTTQQNAELIAALTAQTSTQQGNQQATQQAAELIAALTGRTQTETSHTDDVLGVERIKAAVARGVDNNELASHRLNNIAGDVAQVGSISLGILMTSASVVGAQLQSQVADLGAKNSNNGRLVDDCVKAGHGDCLPCKKD